MLPTRLRCPSSSVTHSCSHRSFSDPSPPISFDALREKLSGARETLEALTEEEMEGWIGQPMRFEFKDRGMDFNAEDFLLTFSQPNFYFHCATAYNIRRMKSLPVGKMDFMGRMQIKR